jgi:hypothetical protein
MHIAGARIAYISFVTAAMGKVYSAFSQVLTTKADADGEARGRRG